MNSEINLLYSKKQLRRYKLTTQVRLIRFIALGMLFLVVVLSVIFFLLVVASPLSSLRKQELQLNQELSQSQEKIRQQTLISLRVSEISNIIQKRSQYNQLLSFLILKLPKNSFINEFSAEKKLAVVTVKAPDMKALEAYLNLLSTEVANKKYFSRVFLDSLSMELGKTTETSFFTARIVLTLL